ncbi:NAD(P)H-dependent oxidoreductase [Pandoraea sp.]|uniref:FMN-dependent NADH-azoreductase n=1 Tax=Pandoraea sp. TaxID=1883445 RepID=UPI0011FC5380|nr:NAD(P)H-dependent oxidoreductase [Pandoraea sp.]TAL55775.1 MAG: FMN-dependent NADH-azoreductase [Pandoraea sp.]TAM19379.1 MAG: FMN-dependent NADH-azoreductase [Pandoraea sp.]
MKAILYIECSPRGAGSQSARVARALLEQLQQAAPQARVIERNLSADPPPLISRAYAEAVLAGALTGDPGEVAVFDYSEMLIDELEQSDCLVIGTPMHNYTVPAALKAWIDHVVRIHRTFRGTPAGKMGLLPDRPTYIVVAAGGIYTGDEARQPDFLTPYLRSILATIGIRSVEFLALEGLTRRPLTDAEVEHRAWSLLNASSDDGAKTRLPELNAAR